MASPYRIAARLTLTGGHFAHVATPKPAGSHDRSLPRGRDTGGQRAAGTAARQPVGLFL